MTTISDSRPSLSKNDSAVLQALFDAESSPSSGVTVSPSMPPWPATVNISSTDLGHLKSREAQIILTLQDTERPDEKVVRSALSELNSLVAQYPTYPSAYTNRAQTLRLLANIQYPQNQTVSDDPASNDSLYAPEASELLSSVFADLGTAIMLATPASPADLVSPVQARLLADAHTHRGYLLLKMARVKKNASQSQNQTVGPEKLRGYSADQLEEMASRDFFLGGRYGNKVAQQMAVQTNPYAKMCGAIVKQAMKKEMTGDS